MLRSLRKNAQSWIIKGIFWIIVLAFVGTIFLVWGRGRDVTHENIVARVNDTVLPVNTFYDEFNRLDQLYREVYGNLYDKLGITKETLKNEALNNLINRVLLLQAADKMKIKVSDEEVMAEIAKNPAFQVNGQFNKERYLQVLSTNHLTPKDYETEKKKELKIRKLTDFIQSTVKVSDEEIKEQYMALKRKLRLNVVKIDPKKMRVDKPTKDEIAKYYAEHREEFRTLPAVNVKYALFTPDEFISGAKLTEQEITTYYEANQEKYLMPEARRFYELSLPIRGSKKKTLEKMTRIRGEILSGKISFAEAVKKYTGKEKKKTPWLEKKSLPSQIAEEAFTLPVDGVTSAFVSGKKVKILKVAEIRSKEPYPLEKIRDRVIEDLKREKARDLAIIKAYEAKGKIAKGAPFEETVSEYGVKVRETGLLTSKEAKGNLKKLIRAAFLKEPGEKPDVLKAGDELFLYTVVEKKPSGIKPLEKVRREIERKLTKQKKMEAARNLAKKIIQKVEKGETLAKVARKMGLTIEKTPYFSPLEQGALPLFGGNPNVIKKVIVLSSSNRVVDEPITISGKIAVIEFAGEKKASLKDFEKEKEKLAEILFEKKKEEALKAFIREERNKAQIEISEEFQKI